MYRGEYKPQCTVRVNLTKSSYFAGHGVQSPGSGESDGHDEHFVCDDLQRIVDNELAALIRQCSASCSLILIFDCCNSGTITDGVAFSEPRSSASPPGGHHVVLSACRDGEYAFQDRRGRGHLTRALTRRLLSRKNVETGWFHSRSVFSAMSQKSIVTVHSEYTTRICSYPRNFSAVLFD